MTTYATAWKITRKDAVVEGYTDHDADLAISGVNYLSSAGYVPSAIERKTSLSPNNQQVVGIIDNDNLSAQDLLAGVYDGARLEFELVDWDALTVVRTLMVATLGGVSIDGEQYSVDLESIEGEFRKPIGINVEVKCRHVFGSAACGYSLSADSGTVDSVTTARRVFVDASLAQADGYYNGGNLVWTAGENIGRAMDVKRYVSATDTVELYEPMPSDVAADDEFDIYRGCDKTIETCVATFSNGENFGGFPYVPGQSNLVSGNT